MRGRSAPGREGGRGPAAPRGGKRLSCPGCKAQRALLGVLGGGKGCPARRGRLRQLPITINPPASPVCVWLLVLELPLQVGSGCAGKLNLGFKSPPPFPGCPQPLCSPQGLAGLAPCPTWLPAAQPGHFLPRQPASPCRGRANGWGSFFEPHCGCSGACRRAGPPRWNGVSKFS